MKAIVNRRYGPPEVLEFEDIERPVPGDDEVLVKVYASTVNRSDCDYRRAHPFFARLFTGLLRPKRRVLGSEFAGEVEAVGAAVTEFEAGDRVFGATDPLLGASEFGAHAQWFCVRERAPIAKKPVDTTFEEAAAVPDGFIASVNCLRRAKLGPGQSILIYGASGSLGTAGVQLARHFGARVTAVCNARNFETVRSLGASEVIDYETTDFTANGERYDVIFDAVGKHSFARCRNSLKRGGVFVEIEIGFLGHVALLAQMTKFIGSKRVIVPIARYRKKEVLLLKELLEAGEYRAVIDRVYPFDQIVEAAAYVESGQKTGSVVLLVAEG